MLLLRVEVGEKPAEAPVAVDVDVARHLVDEPGHLVGVSARGQQLRLEAEGRDHARHEVGDRVPRVPAQPRELRVEPRQPTPRRRAERSVPGVGDGVEEADRLPRVGLGHRVGEGLVDKDAYNSSAINGFDAIGAVRIDGDAPATKEVAL